MAIEQSEQHPETNPDPITGAPGAHPVGVGLGAAAGGIAAGAAAGTFAAGPIGTVVGAAVGAIVGGLAGKGAAESMNPTVDLSARPESDLRLGAARVAQEQAAESVVEPRYIATPVTSDASNALTDASAAARAHDAQARYASDERLPALAAPVRGLTGAAAASSTTAFDAFDDVDSIAVSAAHLSDAAHDAWAETSDLPATARDDATYAVTCDRASRKGVDAVRTAVRRRPWTAMAIGMALGAVVVSGPSFRRAISRRRSF